MSFPDTRARGSRRAGRDDASQTTTDAASRMPKNFRSPKIRLKVFVGSGGTFRIGITIDTATVEGKAMSGTKLVKRLREHDWLAALIELVIVAVGILLALQVSNWNQNREDRNRGERYAQRLHAELVSDGVTMEEAMRFWQQVSDYGNAAMDHSEHGTLVDGSSWKTVLAYFQASQLFPFELEDTTFLEMRDSGELALIVDESLRKRIADYYHMSGSGLRADLLRHRPEYRQQIRGLTPWPVQEYIWTHCFRQGAGVSQTLLDCASPITEPEAATILDGYHKADTLLPNLRVWMSTLRVSEIVVTGMRGDALALANDFADTQGDAAAAAPVAR
jgi:hypothetical protein